MEKIKKLLVLTGGGDCPGLNAVIRALVKRIQKNNKSENRTEKWKIYGSVEAFNGVFNDPPMLVKLSRKKIAGIHVKGGTILRTTNKGNPTSFPVVQEDGTVKLVDRSEELIKRINELGFNAVINIGGDGSQRISQALFAKGLNIIGVPKTIDNDLSATDMTFGFQTAVQIATESFDKLVTTAESHDRVMIMEVMGRDAGWIALHTAIAGGAEICLIPEIPYDIQKIISQIESRYKNGKGFVNIIISEGARPKDGNIVSTQGSQGSEHVRLGGVAYQLSKQLKDAGCKAEIRETVLGHVQRGGMPIAFDRILAALFGVKAAELLLEGSFGQMVCLKNNAISAVTLKQATEAYHFVQIDSPFLNAAQGIGISFGN